MSDPDTPLGTVRFEPTRPAHRAIISPWQDRIAVRTMDSPDAPLVLPPIIPHAPPRHHLSLLQEIGTTAALVFSVASVIGGGGPFVAPPPQTATVLVVHPPTSGQASDGRMLPADAEAEQRDDSSDGFGRLLRQVVDHLADQAIDVALRAVGEAIAAKLFKPEEGSEAEEADLRQLRSLLGPDPDARGDGTMPDAGHPTELGRYVATTLAERARAALCGKGGVIETIEDAAAHDIAGHIRQAIFRGAATEVAAYAIAGAAVYVAADGLQQFCHPETRHAA